ncbi:MAG: putative signal transducing protein [Actinomycetota bacterium]
MTQAPPPEWVKVAVAANEYEAHLMSGCLEEEGIEVVLDPYASGAAAYLHPGGDPTAPVRILVPFDRADDAAGILAAIDSGGVAEGDDVAPQDPIESDGIFAERRAGMPLAVLVAAAVVVAIIVGLTVSDLGLLF